VARTHLPKYNVGAHFLTAKTFQNIPFFHHSGCARIFCEELETARQTYGFHVLAFVVMPDHVHLLLWWEVDKLPNLTISKVAWAIKGRSAKRMVACLKNETAAASLKGLLRPAHWSLDRPHYRNWQYKIWQRGAGYDFNICSAEKLKEKVGYIHANPVRAGLTSRSEDYLWSSAINYAICAGDGSALAHSHDVPIHPVTIMPYTEIA